MEEASPISKAKVYDQQWLLYTMHFCFAFVSRMWDMGVVLLVAELTNNSLFYVAVANLFGALAITFLMPTVGRYLDTTDRLTATTHALFVKVSAVSIVYIGCAGAGDADGVPFFVMYLLPLFCGVAAVTFKTIVTAVEKDWIVVLSAKDTAWLAETNSVMTQIDLGCSSIAPAATGMLFTSFSYSTTAVVLLAINGVSVVGFYFFLVSLYNSYPALQSRKVILDEKLEGTGGEGDSVSASEKVQLEREKSSYGSRTDETTGMGDEPSENSPSRQRGFLEALFGADSSVTHFFKSGCAGVMLAYAFLYLTVLSFGAIMTVYLRWAGLSDHWIGFFRGVNALSGFTGASLFPWLKGSFGLTKTGLGAVWYQFTLVSIASASFLTCGREMSSIVVVYTVLFSRAGLWVFDLATRQIVQETLPEETRGQVNGLWASIISFFNMSSFIMAMLVSDPRDFFILTSVSALFVGLGKGTFAWLCHASPRHATAMILHQNTDIMSLNCIEDYFYWLSRGTRGLWAFVVSMVALTPLSFYLQFFRIVAAVTYTATTAELPLIEYMQTCSTSRFQRLTKMSKEGGAEATSQQYQSLEMESTHARVL